jgi:hydroxyacylglutathione hydrolase
MKVIPIKLFKDNYSYALLNSAAKELYLVDPSDYQAVNSFINQLPDYRLTHILTTHRHWDHCRDNLMFARNYQDLKIVSGVYDDVPGSNLKVTHNEVLSLGNLMLKVIHTPCHTKGHVMYLIGGALFTGDTLFSGGCGKFFEGNAENMWNNFLEVKNLPLDTLMYCGHEYTQTNLEWASKLWENPILHQELNRVKILRSNDTPTVPVTLEKELQINIFMNSHILQDQLNCKTPVQALERLRYMKDHNLIKI